jgi:hypothetical protein
MVRRRYADFSGEVGQAILRATRYLFLLRESINKEINN